MAVWVLEHLPRALDDARVAFVATSRNAEPDMPRLDTLRRVSRMLPLAGLDVDAVRQLAAAEAPGSVGAAGLHARTGGNPLFVKELVRSPDGSGVIDEVLQRSLDRFDTESAWTLATAAVAGGGTPLSVLALACSCTTDAVVERLEPAVREGVLDDVSPAGVRFHHALLAEAAERLGDPRELHDRLAAAWTVVDGVDGRAAAVGHRLRAAVGTSAAAGSVEKACAVAAELVALDQQARAAALLWEARHAATGCVEPRELRANVALDLAKVLSWLGDLDPALSLYQEAAQLARECENPVTRARAEVGANLWATAFVPDLPRMRRLEEALDRLPPEELRLRARLLGRLTIVGSADVDATDRVRAWADEAVAVARTTGDPVLIAQSLLDQTMSPTSRSHWTPASSRRTRSSAAPSTLVGPTSRSTVISAAPATTSTTATSALPARHWGAPRCWPRAAAFPELAPEHVAPAHHAPRAERQSLGRDRGDARGGARRDRAHRTGGRARVRGAAHLMLFDLYGHPDPRAQEIHRITMEMLDAVPSPVFQVQKGFGAQLFGDESSVHEVLHRFGSAPGQLLRSMTGDHLLRVFGDTVARAGATTYAGPVYRALLPYAGLLNVGGGHSAGLPVDDVLGRVAALDGDVVSAVRHARDAVTLARSMPSPPLLVHCLDHLADAVECAGDSTAELDVDVVRAEADTLAAAIDIQRPGRAVPAGLSDTSASASIRRDGPMWVLASPLGTARLPNGIGLPQLARLLRTPREEVTAVELGGRTDTPVAADLGPALDADAKRAYRRRLLVLQAEVDDADTVGDPVRAERAHVEMEALLRELKRAVGLGGRDRPSGSGAERARVNVVRSLRRTIAAIAQQAPLLGAHLEASVRTGGHCIYLPEPGSELSWTVPADTNRVGASTTP
jgi:hypothetical protein